MGAFETAAFEVGRRVRVVATPHEPDCCPEALALLERVGQVGTVDGLESPDEHDYWIRVRFETPDVDGDYEISFAADELEPA